MNNLSRLHASAVVLAVLMSLLVSKGSATESVCYGFTYNGALNGAFQLPQSGDNFKAYSLMGWLLGRTYLHKKVAAVVLETYRNLHTQFPNKEFMYAETGWAVGGDFAPHKTHQNGLSVDFMVPVVNSKGASVYLPVGIGNKWGYDIEFDGAGEYERYRIDFEAMAEHLKLLHENTQAAGFSIKRVYFDPRLQGELFNTKQGKFIKKHFEFNAKQAWVRHDEHYHVDFDVDCLSLEAY